MISEIIESFEEEAGVDIPTNLISDIKTTQDFVMGVMHIELVDNTPSTLGLDLDGFGSSQGADGSDFGWNDSLINVAGLSMQNLIPDVQIMTKPFFPDLISYADLSGLQASDITIYNIYLYWSLFSFLNLIGTMIRLTKEVIMHKIKVQDQILMKTKMADFGSRRSSRYRSAKIGYR